jgi:HK97 family phage portal protein
MKIFGRQLGRERRSSIEDPRVPISDTSALLAFFGVDTTNLPAVTLESALSVPAFSAGVTFLSRTLANLPLHAFRDGGDKGPERLAGALQRILNEAPNAEWTSFGWRRYFWQQVFSRPGRGLAWIERRGTAVVGIWPIDAQATTVRRINGRRFYYVPGQAEPYPAADIIDVPFLLKADQLNVASPVELAKPALQASIAMSNYAAGFFAGGGVPPLALVGPMPAGNDAVKRAQDDIQRAIAASRADGRSIFPIPSGYDLKPVGFDPDKGQMTDARVFQIQEIARVLNLPPVFLQELSRGTYTNTDQQDLQLGKHVVAGWAKAFEEELNLKLFGAANNRRYIEHSVDGLMRGDFTNRMEGMARAVNSALMTPNEGRALDNRPPLPGGDQLLVQGATVPLARAGETPHAGAQTDHGNTDNTASADGEQATNA